MMDFYYAEHHTRSTFRRKIYLTHPDTELLLRSLRLPAAYLSLRRAVETACIIASLPITLPLCALVALAVRIDSPGPIFFRQLRPGRNGRRFVMMKFRTMLTQAPGALRLTDAHDVRITPLGRFLRRHRIDELPQLWHVLRGTMSLIGPRPDPVEQAEACTRALPLYPYRYMIRPGITGWGQVHSGYAHDVEATRAKLEDDLFYIVNLSPWLDAVIVLKTIATIVTGRGAR